MDQNESITTYRRDLLNPAEESRMFPKKSVIYFGLDVACLLQSAAMVAKKLLVDYKNNSLFQTNVSWVLYVKFRREKHYLVKHFTFLKNVAINI